MEIELKIKFGYELIFTEENVRVSEDIEERIYSKDANGKTDFKVPPTRDIKTEAIQKFSDVLYEMIYFRDADFDSSGLIEKLFEKLPSDVADTLFAKLKSDYYE